MEFNLQRHGDVNRAANGKCATFKLASLVWPLLLVGFATGCGQSGPDLAPVKGRVTLDGRPLDTVDVVFQPTKGDPPSTSRTDAEGHYELLYKRGFAGAHIGEHIVRIEFTSNIVKNPPNVPDRYNKQSELRREVKSGQNEFDFDLTSEGK
jgi:hypothetical protein